MSGRQQATQPIPRNFDSKVIKVVVKTIWHFNVVLCFHLLYHDRRLHAKCLLRSSSRAEEGQHNGKTKAHLVKSSHRQRTGTPPLPPQYSFMFKRSIKSRKDDAVTGIKSLLLLISSNPAKRHATSPARNLAHGKNETKVKENSRECCFDACDDLP
jgi:hypothetical protein